MKTLKSFLATLLLMCCLSVNAQSVSYIHEPFSAHGCKMKFSVEKEGLTYFLVVKMRSEGMHFANEPQILIRTFNDDLIEVYGEIITDKYVEKKWTETSSWSIVYDRTIARFEMDPKQFEMLKDGVARIRISTVPVEHEKIFEKDKIGKKIYKSFLKKIRKK